MRPIKWPHDPDFKEAEKNIAWTFTTVWPSELDVLEQGTRVANFFADNVAQHYERVAAQTWWVRVTP